MNPNAALSTIMTKNLVTVRPSDTVQTVKNIFSKFNIHHIPVETENNKLVGIVSKEDILSLSNWLSKNVMGNKDSKTVYNSMAVEEIMTPNPLSLDPDDTIGLAADIFLANKFRAVPIVEDSKLVGLVTTYDLIAYSFESPVVEKQENEQLID